MDKERTFNIRCAEEIKIMGMFDLNIIINEMIYRCNQPLIRTLFNREYKKRSFLTP